MCRDDLRRGARVRSERRSRRARVVASTMIVLPWLLAAPGLGAEPALFEPRLLEPRIPRLLAPLPAGTELPKMDSPAMRVELSRTRRSPFRAPGGFYREHLLPRLSRQFEGLRPLVPPAWTTADLERHQNFGDLRELAILQVEKGARKSVKDYLLEATSIESWIDGVRGRHPSGGSIGPARHGESRLRFRPRIVHAVPVAELDYRTADLEFRLGVSVRGAIGVELRHRMRSDARLAAGYDPGSRSFTLTGSIRW